MEAVKSGNFDWRVLLRTTKAAWVGEDTYLVQYLLANVWCCISFSGDPLAKQEGLQFEHRRPLSYEIKEKREKVGDLLQNCIHSARFNATIKRGFETKPLLFEEKELWGRHSFWCPILPVDGKVSWMLRKSGLCRFWPTKPRRFD